MNTLAIRLLNALTVRKKTPADLSRAVGRSESAVSQWLSGETKSMRGDNLLETSAFLSCSPQWLASGKGLSGLVDKEIQASGKERIGLADDITIPQYEAGGAMGDGLILEDKQPGLIKSWHVDHEWLRLNVPHHTGVKNLCIVTGFGPSMKPKYNSGDPLLLDRGVKVVDSDGIYFFRVGKHGFIKQLQRIPTEGGMIIRAKSLNKDYDSFDITAKMDFEVFGKVLTVWRSEQV